MAIIGLHAVFLFSAGAMLAQTPRIDSVTPTRVPINGGIEVSIRGENLDAASVSLDGVLITPTVVSAGEIRFIAPKRDNGFASITARRGSTVSYGEFLYVPPLLRDLPPGAITTVAGVGSYFGDGRPATAAGVNATNLATDAAGNIYIAEPGLDQVRRIRTDGVIERFIGTGRPGTGGDGGPALQADLNFPRGLAIDRTGNFYVGDSSQRVRRVDGKTGIIETIAGTGVKGFSGDGGPAIRAQFREPVQLAFDGQGNLYILDAENFRIRKITPDGIVRTIAGTGVAGFSGDGGPALQAQFDIRNGDFGAIAADATGNVFLADTGNNRVRKIDSATGIISTIAQAQGVTNVFVDPQGNLWFAADANCGRPPCKTGPRIIKTNANGDVLDSISELWGFSPDGTEARKAAFSFIYRLGQDRNGNLLVAENWTLLRRINGSTGLLETIAGTGAAIPGENGPADAALIAASNEQGDLQMFPNGDLLIDDNRLRRLDRAGNISTFAGGVLTVWPFVNDQPATQVSFGGATAAKPDSAGNMWITSCCLSALLQIDKSGLAHMRIGGTGFEGDGGPASRAKLDQPWDVLVDGAGNLLIADSNNNRVRKVDAMTGVITTIAGSGAVNGWENYGNGTSCGDGGPATQACINTPYGLALDRDGTLYISEPHSGRIRKVDPSGIISTFANGIFTTKMALDAAGNLYGVAISRVVRIRPDGNVTTIAGGNGTGMGGDGGPALEARIFSGGQGVGIAIDEEGNVYFLDRINHRVRAIRYGAVLAPAETRAQARGGTPQSANIGTRFTDQLVAYLSDARGVPAGNVRVDFAAPPSGASCAFSNQQRQISVLTDRNGVAAAACTANSVTGAYTITARPLGVSTSISFALTNTPPRLAANSIVNGASFLSGAVAPGEIISVFGAGVGPAELVQATPGADGRYARQLAGVRVLFNGAAAPVLFARSDVVGVVAPYSLDGAAQAQVIVEYAGVPSNSITAPVSAAAPAVFTADSSGRGQGAILNQDNSVNSAANPASRGSIVVLYGTGQGQTDPPGADGKLALDEFSKPRLPVSVEIGNQKAEILYAGAAPGLVAGVLQVNVRIPAQVTPDPAVPVSLSVGGIRTSQSVTVAVR